MHQLALQLRLRDASRIDGFVAGPNREAVAAVERIGREGGCSVTWLWGREGTGKTHLLQAACALAGERGAAAAYLDLGVHHEPALLEGCETLGLVALDALDEAVAVPEWNRALFRLHTLIEEAGGALLLASRSAPASMAFTLPDLGSRLRAAAIFQLHELAERDQLEALQRRAARRGLELSAESAAFLLHRLPRDLRSLCAMLDRLDEASLEARRRLTIPFLRRALELDAATGDPGGRPISA